MFRLKLYYHAKPFLPWGFRMAIRRLFAFRKRQRYQATWPIDPSSSLSPSDWSGWPDDKSFAFLLSHDVETQIGYDKIGPLVDLEESLGFRSVVNFIPEGQYRISDQLIKDLKARGFEVGVHGLHHDGKLYNSLVRFNLRSKKINKYLKDWGATGFRSPLMHHNLNWLHALNIAYDASTFDTDPFEPQPDGVKTIFPFWVPKHPEIGSQRPEVGEQKPEGRPQTSEHRTQESSSTLPPSLDGYVEIPYTLPQDSTLYLLLKEKTNKIWKEKTAWLSQNGGMAFMNVHPDYIDFNENGSPSTYPVSLYKEYLEHVKAAYGGQYWHATPGEVASRFRPGVGVLKSEIRDPNL